MKNKRILLLLLLFFMSFVVIPAIYSQISPIGASLQEEGSNTPGLKARGSTSYSIQWLDKPDFASPISPTWYQTRSGDLSDVAAKDGSGQANMTVIGDKRTMSIVANPPSSPTWRAFSNPEFPVLPNVGYGFDSAGAYARHTWQESTSQTGNTPSVLFKRNITMPVSMSDYKITSASVVCIVNASTLRDVDVPGDTAHGGSGGGFVGSVYDYVRFYVLVSDLAGIQKYEIAYNKTRYLGLNIPPNSAAGTSLMGNAYMITVPQDILIFYLTSVLESDYRNFTITLGIFIYCEDNCVNYDLDTFSWLRIKYFNLTFAYEKYINRDTYVSWNQIGNQLPKINQSQEILQVDGARLYFKYRNDRNWTSESPNSELRILVNNQTYPETVKLNKATRTFQAAKLGGFDVTSYIVKDVNISVGILMYIADNFVLSRNTTFSIDDAYLWINYTIIDIPPPQPPSINVVANTSSPFTDHWTNITVTCVSGSANVSRLWYLNPFSNTDVTLDTNFAGTRVYNLYFLNDTAGSYLFKFWANASIGGQGYDDITIVWVKPQSPTLNVVVNISNPYLNYWAQFTVACQSGSADVSKLWYYDPFLLTNVTLESNFEGLKVHYLNFTSGTASSYEFRFWANSTLGADVYRTLTVVWIQLIAPTISLNANITNPYTNHGMQLTITCQSGSGSVNTLWYYDPIDLSNHTLTNDFTGSRTYYLNFTSSTAGPREFKVWANSSYKLETYQFITVIWVDPQAPIITRNSNISNPFINRGVQLQLTAQSGSGVISLVWYYNPLDLNNYTIDSNFAGGRTYYLNFTSPTAGPREFKFWANSSLGLVTAESIIIVWIEPTPSIVTVNANTTSPYINRWTQLKVTAQSGTGPISVLWFYNPLDLSNNTLDSNFAGSRTFYLNFTSSTAGAREFKFWANSTTGSVTYQAITIVWLEPTPPILTVNSNTTTPYVNRGTQLRVTCQSGIGAINVIWYYDPFDLSNHTIDTNFLGIRVYYLNFTNPTSGALEFKFWANSSFGLETYQPITIIWIVPQPPVLTVTADIMTPYVNLRAQLKVTCQSGTGDVAVLWYNDPFDLNNHTIDGSYTGIHIHYLNFTSPTAGAREFKFWANSSSGLSVYQSITVIWIDPQPPVLTVTANTTNPYTNLGTRLTVTCQSGTGNNSVLWFYNPLDLANQTIDTNFAGRRTYYLNFTSATAGPREFMFWVNSSIGLVVDRSIVVIWIDPQPPILTITANITTPFVNFWAQLTVTCQSGSVNVSALWFYNPLDLSNQTLKADFAGSRTFYLNFTTATAGPREFIFWANSSLNLEVSRSMIIFWVSPQAPGLTLEANITIVEVDLGTQIKVTSQSGSGNVSVLWYYNPLDLSNHTIDSNYAGVRLYYLNFTSAVPGNYNFKFWVNSSFGLVEYRFITIIWITPTPPSISAVSNESNPFTDRWVQITVSVQSSTGAVESVWYYNPLDLNNHTIDNNFIGIRTYHLNFTSSVAGAYIFTFWAKSVSQLVVFETVLVVWVVPQPPIISAGYNVTNIYPTEWTRITVTVQAGSGKVSYFWYYNPLDGNNYTLAMDFLIFQTQLYFTSAIPGTFIFKFWANSTFGLLVEKEVTIVWLAPDPPTLTIDPSSRNPYVDVRIYLTIICRSGTGSVDTLWLYNPLTGQNVTLDTNFVGERTYYLNFTQGTAGVYEFTVWANSSYGVESSKSDTVVWVARPEIPYLPWIIGGLAVALAAVAAIVGSYMLYFKVPKTVRMIRRTKGAILKGKPTSPLPVSPRETMVNDTFNKIMKTKKLPLAKEEAPGVTVRKGKALAE